MVVHPFLEFVENDYIAYPWSIASSNKFGEKAYLNVLDSESFI